MSMRSFNENSRVKIPALLHLERLGYRYLSLKHATWDKRNNIFPELFEAALLRINHDLDPGEAHRLLDAINLELQNPDLGRAWFNHKRLLEPIGNIPPAEAEANYYRQQAALPVAT